MVSASGPCNGSVNDNYSEVQCRESNTTPTAEPEYVWDLQTSEGIAAVIATIYSVIFVIAFSWNLFVILFVLKNRKLLKDPPSIFLLSLAIVDFMEAVTSIPFYVATLIGGGWIFGETDEMRLAFCKAVGFFLTVFLGVSVYILSIIALDRFLYIFCALKYHKLMKPWRAWLLVLVFCIPPIIIASTPLYGFGEYFFFLEFGVCLFHWRGETEYVVAFCLIMMVPITMIVVFTILTYCYVRRFLHKRQRRHSQWNLNISMSTNNVRDVIKEHKAKRKNLNRIFIALLVTQLVCFAPGLLTAFVGRIIGSYDPVPDIIFFIDFVFVLSNAALNPIIQSGFRKPIREALQSKFRLIGALLKCPESKTPDKVPRDYNRQVTTQSVLTLSGNIDNTINSIYDGKENGAVAADGSESIVQPDDTRTDYTMFSSPSPDLKE